MVTVLRSPLVRVVAGFWLIGGVSVLAAAYKQPFALASLEDPC